jgi:hypothetical protein
MLWSWRTVIRRPEARRRMFAQWEMPLRSAAQSVSVSTVAVVARAGILALVR